MRRLLSGAEAIARGAMEAGVHLAAACPGAVANDVLEAFARSGEVACRRAPSEKVALEVALGASLAGARSLAALCPGGHEPGPLAAAAAAGAAGLAVLACDDPGGRLGSGADSRLAARAALVPVLEPSDPGECRSFLGAAFELSERFETPVAVRVTARLADSARAVELGPRRARPPRGWRWEPPSRREVPGRGLAARSRSRERLALLAAHGLDTPLNRVEVRSTDLGVVTSGMAYDLVREALPEASVLKLGMVYPVPTGLVRSFAARVRHLLVVEELEPVLESEIRAAGIACEGRDRITRSGELTAGLLARALGRSTSHPEPEPTPVRPPEQCPGCPHRAVLRALRQLHLSATGDLGCPGLGALPPLAAVDRAPGLGASVGVGAGLEEVLGDRIAGRSVTLVGDGALLHSALPGLLLARGLVIVADDRPEGAGPPEIAGLCRAMGFASVREVDPLDLSATAGAVERAVRARRPEAIVARSPCGRLRGGARPPLRVDPRRCNRCGACLRLGCPALSAGGVAAAIDPSRCAGCTLCAQVCRPGAIGPEARA